MLAGRQADREAGRQEDREEDRWKDRQTMCEAGRQAG